MIGFVLVDKPGGSTSHDVVGNARRLFGIKKIGHAGTLDPMATGLVILGLGRATRLLRFVQDLPKTYVATAVFGIATDTLDADGAVLAREPMPIDRQELEQVVPRFVGHISQVPPMVSALRVGGRRLYELAREGKEVDRPARPVRIDALTILDFAPGPYPEVTFEVTCGSGTYVRSLADDMAGALGGQAHLTALRRTRNGGHLVEDAHTMERLEAAAGDGTIGELVLTPNEALRDMEVRDVDDQTAVGVTHGARYPAEVLDAPADGSPFRVVSGDRLLAVYRVDGKLAVPEVVLG